MRGVGVRNAVEVKLGVGGAKHAHGAIQSRGVQLCWRRVEEEENGPRRKTLRQWCQEGATVHGSAAPIRDVVLLSYLRAQAIGDGDADRQWGAKRLADLRNDTKPKTVQMLHKANIVTADASSKAESG